MSWSRTARPWVLTTFRGQTANKIRDCWSQHGRSHLMSIRRPQVNGKDLFGVRRQLKAAIRRFSLDAASKSRPRLLKTKSYEFAEPTQTLDSIKGQYAILSHTWRQDGDEISLRDMLPQQIETSRSREVFHKIRLTCEEAHRDMLDYVWIDTCCIDKTSSAELSEAINSMYTWYSDARVCYVYMSDVELVGGEASFRQSRWFTRAWTLQELLAPRDVRFYDRDWKLLGILADPVFAALVSSVTGIDINLLLRRSALRNYSIPQRMSWAAYRQASRVEDRAYSLLGIFDVNMPMLYGEGNKVFTRLQEQIIRSSTDHSIFCWELPSNRDRNHRPPSRPLFAPSPSYFANGRSIIQNPTSLPSPYEMTNRGLEITLPIQAYSHSTHGRNLTCAMLNCVHDHERTKPLLLRLQRQYDLDAQTLQGIEPGMRKAHQRRQDTFNVFMGRDFDWHFVASYARRGFTVGHGRQGPRIETSAEAKGKFQEQTIVILVDDSMAGMPDLGPELMIANLVVDICRFLLLQAAYFIPVVLLIMVLNRAGIL